MKTKVLSLVVACAVLAVTTAGIAPAADEHTVYVEDRISLQVLSGALFAPTGLGPDTPTFNYIPVNARLGWMLNTPKGNAGFFRGNWEMLAEVTAAWIYDSFGSYYVGVTPLIRYNFVQPDARIVPYVQGGWGIVFTDAHEEDDQRAIGQELEFTPQISVGLRYLLNDKWSFDAEGMWHHISNADLDERNAGINALGGFVGFTYFFDELWQ